MQTPGSSQHSFPSLGSPVVAAVWSCSCSQSHTYNPTARTSALSSGSCSAWMQKVEKFLPQRMLECGGVGRVLRGFLV